MGSLPDGYNGLDDIVFNGFNIDHVVVGPGGIFLIETKSFPGKVESRGDMLLLNGKPPAKDHTKQTWGQTYSLKEFLWTQTSQEWKVKPILCFPNADVWVRQPVKGIAVSSLKYLNTYLAKQPAVFQADDVTKLSKTLELWTTRLDEGKDQELFTRRRK